MIKKDVDTNKVSLLGAVLIHGALKRLKEILNPFPIPTSIQEMVDKINNKLNIVYMTDEEVMKYLIEISNGEEKENPLA